MHVRCRCGNAGTGRCGRDPVPRPGRGPAAADREAQRETEQRHAAGRARADRLAAAAVLAPAARDLLLDLVADLLARNRDDTVDQDAACIPHRMQPDTSSSQTQRARDHVGLAMRFSHLL